MYILWTRVSSDSGGFVVLASHKTVLQERQQEFQLSWDKLKEEHQASLEALTQKCLTLEEELGMGLWLRCDYHLVSVCVCTPTWRMCRSPEDCEY